MRNKSAYIWNTIGRFIPQGMYLITTLILARFLTPQDFGKIGVLTIFLTIANTLMDSGFGGSLINKQKVDKDDYSTIFVFNTTISAILYIVLFCFAPKIENLFNTDGISGIMRLLCLVFLINSWGIIPNTLLIKQLQFKLIMIRNVISTIIASCFGILLAFYDYGAYAIVGYQLMYASLCVIQNYYYTRYRIRFKFEYYRFRQLFSFGFFTTVCNIIDSAYENILTFLFGKYLSVQKAGYLDQAQKLEGTATQSLTTTINNVSFPILVQLRDDLKEFIVEANRITIAVIFLIFPILSLITVFSDTIIEVLYGEEWLPSAKYLSILIFAGYFVIIEYLYRNFIKSYSSVRILLYGTIFKRTIGIGIILAFVFYNANLAIWGYVASSIIGSITNIILYMYCLKLKHSNTVKNLLYSLTGQAFLLSILYFVYCVISNIYQLIIVIIAIYLIYYIATFLQLKKKSLL